MGVNVILFIHGAKMTRGIRMTGLFFYLLTATLFLDKTFAATVEKDSGCGVSVGCFHDCSGSTCSFILTWVEDGNDIHFVLKCARSETDPYCAVGLSSNLKMGDDHVFECLSTSSTANVYLSYNSGYTNSRLDQNQYGMSSISTSYTNSILTCDFRRRVTYALAVGRKKRAVTSASTYFDLNTDWYLLYAYGTNSGGALGKHGTLPLVSTVVADFQKLDDISATTIKRPLIKAHGILMVFAWMLLSTFGMVIARYFKTTWPEDTEWFGVKPWFIIHRVCMVVCLLLTAISFIIIFVDVEGYVEIIGSSYKKSHPVLGIIVMCLVLINPVMALFRPKPDHPKRIIFRVAHMLVGVAAQTMAIVNLFSGTELDTIQVSSNVRVVLGIFLAWYLTVELGLFVYDCVTSNQEKNAVATDSEKEGKGHDHELRSTGETSQGTELHGYNKLKMAVLVVHVLALLAFTIAVSAIIGSAD